jgi:hypothetical protein
MGLPGAAQQHWLPTGTMIFLTMAVLSLAATLIVLTRLN